MIVWEMDGATRRFTRVSGGAEAVLGYPLERWHGVPGFWIGILHPEDRERVARAIWRALREQQDCQIEYRAIASDGSVVRLRDRVRVTRDEAGGLVLQGSIVDLTERPISVPQRRRRGRRRYRRDLTRGIHEGPDRLFGVPPAGVPPAAEAPPPVPAPPESTGSAGAVETGAPEESAAAPRAGVPSPTPPSDWKYPFEAGSVEEAEAPVDELEPIELVPSAPAEPEPAVASARETGAVRILHALSEAVVASDAEHRIVYWSPAAERLLGWPSSEAIGREDGDLLRAHASPGQTSAIIEGLLERRPWSAEVQVQKRDDTAIPVRIGAAVLIGDGGRVAGYVAVITDLRETREAERKRSAAATMDAVARLARGVADELARGVERVETALRSVLVRVPPDDASRAGLDEALRGVDSAAALAAELAFVGRSAERGPALVDLHDLVERSMPAIRLLVPDGVEVGVDAQPSVRPAAASPGLVSQVLMHLVADSGAALGEAGRITIGIRSEILSTREAERLSARLEAGEWVVLEVGDDRASLPPDLDRIFEPFHDPRTGQERGLGLAAAHGLVTGAGGVLVAAAGEAGLTFRIWFRPGSTRVG